MEAYNLIKLGQQVVTDPNTVIAWCQQHNLLPSEKECNHCRIPMSVRTDHGIGQFRCRRCNQGSCSIANGTWFEGIQSKVMVAKGLLLTYSFAIGLSYDQAVRETTIIESGTKTRFCLFGLSQKPFFRLSPRKKVFAAAEEAGNVERNDGRSQARPSCSEDISSLPTVQHKNSFSSAV